MNELAADPEPEPVEVKGKDIKLAEAVDQSKNKVNIGFFDGNGQHTLYNKNRQISQKGELKHGKLLNGKVYRYDSDGLLINIEVFRNGAYVGDAPIEKDMM